MTEFKFVDELPPKAPAGGGGNYDEFRDALRARPGKWAVHPKVFDGPNGKSAARSTASNIRSGRLPSWDGFGAEARQDVVYVRFVGESVDA